MNNKNVSGGVVHSVPEDLKKTLTSDIKAIQIWNSLTPLVKKEETRKDHVRRVVIELKDEMRRPCCWAGCIHRKNKP